MANAKALEARTRMAALIAKHTNAHLDAEAIVDWQNNIVVSGNVGELALVAAWAGLVGLEGVVVEAPEPDDGEWTVCRIPLVSLEKALATLQARK